MTRTTIRSIVSKFSDKSTLRSGHNGSITKLTVTDGQYHVDFYKILRVNLSSL